MVALGSSQLRFETSHSSAENFSMAGRRGISPRKPLPHKGSSGLFYDAAQGKKDARYFDAVLGRFTNRDPLGYVDGYSMYRGYFVPSGTDPSGKFFFLLPAIPIFGGGAAAGGAAAGGGVGAAALIGGGAAILSGQAVMSLSNAKSSSPSNKEKCKKLKVKFLTTMTIAGYAARQDIGIAIPGWQKDKIGGDSFDTLHTVMKTVSRTMQALLCCKPCDKGQKHHIFTKYPMAGTMDSIGVKFKKMFESVGRNIKTDPNNLVEIPGHRGPHPYALHYLLGKKMDKVMKLQDRFLRDAKLLKTLKEEAAESKTPCSVKNLMITRGSTVK